MKNKEIFIDEKHLGPMSSDELEALLTIQTEGIFHLYSQMMNSISFKLNDKFKILTEVLNKIDYDGIDTMKVEIMKDRKEIDKVKSEVESKRSKIEEKLKSLKDKFEKVKESDSQLVEGNKKVRKFLDKIKQQADNIHRSTNEIKEELISETKNATSTPLHEKLNPNIINKNLLAKQSLFNKSINKLRKNLTEGDLLLSNILK